MESDFPKNETRKGRIDEVVNLGIAEAEKRGIGNQGLGEVQNSKTEEIRNYSDVRSVENLKYRTVWELCLYNNALFPQEIFLMIERSLTCNCAEWVFHWRAPE